LPVSLTVIAALVRPGFRTASRARSARPHHGKENNMTNTNCLDGIRCPRCKQSDAFYIVASHEVRVTDAGTDDEGGDWEWNGDSQSRCADDCCGFSGELREFQVKNQPRDPLHDEDYDSNDDQIADLKEEVTALREAGRAVVDAWSSGDLASAVRQLDAVIGDA
jgi:hypothetical protein